MFTIPLGVTVTDRITGFSGVVTGRCDYMTGCNRYQVQPRVKADGTFVESVWFDEHVLVVDEAIQTVILPDTSAQARGAWGRDPR